MPNLKKHCAISRKRTGRDFRELHRWIDEPHKVLGYNHRIKRHAYTKEDKEYIWSYWDKKGGLGDQAVVEWLFHIAIDNLETAFKESRKAYGSKRYNCFVFGLAESGYIHFNFDTLDEDELEEELGEDSTEDSCDDIWM